MDGTLTIGVHDFDLMRRELGLAPDADILKTMQSMSASKLRHCGPNLMNWNIILPA